MRFDEVPVGTEFFSNYPRGGLKRKYRKSQEKASIWEGNTHREGGCAHQIPTSEFIRELGVGRIFCFPNDLNVEVS